MSAFVLSGAAVAGIVVAVVIFLLLGAVAVCLCYKYFFKVSPQLERVSAGPEELIKM